MSAEERIQRGREATVALGMTEPFINDMIGGHLNTLVSCVRGNSATFEKLMFGVSSISALMQLRDRLAVEADRGDSEAAKEYGHGKA